MNCFFEDFELGFLLVALDSRIAEFDENSKDYVIMQDYKKLRGKVEKYLKESET